MHVSVDLLIHEAPRAEVNDLKLRSGRVNAQNVFRLQITVDNLTSFEEDEGFEQLSSIRAYLFLWEAHEFILFQMFKQIRVEKLEDEALMLSKVNVLYHPDDVVLISGVLVHEEL